MKEVYIEGIGKCYDVDCVADCLSLIIDIGFDYDGCNSVDSLKSLVDELVEYARRGAEFLLEGKIQSVDKN